MSCGESAILAVEIHFRRGISYGYIKYPYFDNRLKSCLMHTFSNSFNFLSFDSLTVVHLHSFVLIVQGTTMATCIAARNNALFPLLISNNFGEIKSNVFKRFSKDNIRSQVYSGEWHLVFLFSTSIWCYISSSCCYF